MKGYELIELFQKGTKRYHLLGTQDNGVLAGLDLEGRLYTIVDGEVVNRVNPEAILGITDRNAYLNPGGDGLWPAPEGTCFGYEYASGNWRVPPGLTGAQYKVVKFDEKNMLIEAEVDLINASGLGIATIFRRDVYLDNSGSFIAVKVIESIEYIGSKQLSRAECLLTPWSLAQFDCCPGCEVVFPETDSSEVWDLYDSSEECRFIENGLWHTHTDGRARYQIGIGTAVPWIELQLPSKKMKIRRTASVLENGQDYIDIIDAPPSELPGKKGIRYSVYSDTNGFMEAEAAGGCPQLFTNGTVMNVEILTEYFNA
jgi:hypothetical protein